MALFSLSESRLAEQLFSQTMFSKTFHNNEKSLMLDKSFSEKFVPNLLLIHSFICLVLSLWLIESREGISPSRSHGTVLESLPSHGSSCLITKVQTLYGFTNFQCGKSKGDSLYFLCNHLKEAIL